MSVLFETSVGDWTIDLFCEICPQATYNFLKLCKQKFYHGAMISQLFRQHIAKVTHPDKKPTTVFE